MTPARLSGSARTLAAACLLLLIGVAGPWACDPEEELGGVDGSLERQAASAGASAAKAPPEKITIAGKTYTLELAKDESARSKGMGGRTTLAADAGMLFVFPDSQRRTFWMRDCTLDLDIIFLDPLGFVTAVHHMPAEPPRRADESESAYLARLKSYSSVSPARYAIELRGGDAAKLGVKPNQKIDAEWRRIKTLAQ
jgi:hypothetical protein